MSLEWRRLVFSNYFTFYWMESYLLLEWTESDRNEPPKEKKVLTTYLQTVNLTLTSTQRKKKTSREEADADQQAKHNEVITMHMDLEYQIISFCKVNESVFRMNEKISSTNFPTMCVPSASRGNTDLRKINRLLHPPPSRSALQGRWNGDNGASEKSTSQLVLYFEQIWNVLIPVSVSGSEPWNTTSAARMDETPRPRWGYCL